MNKDLVGSLAWFGNRMPKAFVPSAWARRGGCGAVVAGILVTLGYCLSLRARAKAA